jgi:lipoprotein-anchoring transpeptidase ErfK/SrfK
VELRTWLPRYTVIQVYDTRQVDGLNWYMIGVDQWVDQRKVGLVEPNAVPPADVPIGTRWITINLFEQTLAAYDNGRLVFATLVASGIPPWHTRPGTFQVFKKVDRQPMSGSFAADRSDYYYLQDVPWVLYFDRARALHGTYWHDGFGYKRSHGCVNMSIGDARWIYEWADLGTWVYVTDPSGQTPSDAATYANDAGGP